MYLNLKSKRLIEGTATGFHKASGHPKTHRQHENDRSSRQHRQIKSTRQPLNMHKKQTASTAMTSAQPSNHSYANVSHHFVLPRPESLDKDTKNCINRSHQKIEITRNEKVSKVYRKLKKFETEDHHVLAEEAPSPQDHKLKLKQNMTVRPANRKEVISNFANNYIAITEPDQSLERKREKNSARQNPQSIEQMLDVLQEVFDREGPTISSARTKFRSKSSRDFDLNHSLEKDGSRKRPKTNHNNKEANQILIQEQESHHPRYQEEESLHALVDHFVRNIARVNTKMDDVVIMSQNSDRRQGNKFKAFLKQMQLMVLEIYERFIKTMSKTAEQYQKAIESVVEEEYDMRNKCKQLQSCLVKEKQKNDILLKNLQQVTIKSLYSSAFMGQLSDKLDLHSILGKKIYYEAVKNGYITRGTSRNASSRFDSERNDTFAMEQNQFMSDSFNFPHSEVVRPHH